jgi:hypothetical protein
MKKKTLRRVHHRKASTRRGHVSENYLVVVRGWMLVVAFALMLGVGAIVGNFVAEQMDQANPAVAGVSVGE